MKRTFSIILSLFLLFALYCSKPEAESGKLQVAASIVPLADFVHQIGGDRVEVLTIIPPGANPHSFEFTPGLMKKLARADLLLFNGVGLEFWLDNVIDNLQGKKAVFTAKDLDILADDEHHHAEGNPHVWLNPRNAIHQVERIALALADVDSANSEYYSGNAALYIKHLEMLDQDIEQRVSTWQQKSFVCFHPAWEYFAERYGLNQAAVIEKRPGMEASPADIADIIETVKNIGAKAIFVEAQFPSRVAEMIADETDIGVVALDPLGGSQDITNYVDLMRYNVSQMATVMKE